MEEKAGNGSAFLFAYLSLPIRAISVPKRSKKGEKFLIFFFENKSLKYLELSKILCTFAHS